MNTVLVTTSWDDGHVLDIRVARLLNYYGLAGTFYISPLDHEFAPPDRLSDEEIAFIAERFEIGAHTMTHTHLTYMSDAQAEEEILWSKEYLNRIVDAPIRSFCYPSGRYRLAHVELLQRAGFTHARTEERFATSSPDLLQLKTTVQAYRHWSDAWPIFRAVGREAFVDCYLNWDTLALVLFEQVLARGGVFHLWGHALEIEQQGDWEKLERVLQYISHRSDVTYVTNGELR